MFFVLFGNPGQLAGCHTFSNWSSKLERYFISTKSSDGGGQDPVSLNPQSECLSAGVLSYCEALVPGSEGKLTQKGIGGCVASSGGYGQLLL